MGLHSFLDIGTGTGILAIAASKLGFNRVVGVDIDPLAVDAATRNVLLNQLAGVDIIEGPIDHAKGVFDMVTANLMSEILVSLAPDLASRLNSPGIAILSGMLPGEEDGVISATESHGLSLLEKVIDGRWISLVFLN